MLGPQKAQLSVCEDAESVEHAELPLGAHVAPESDHWTLVLRLDTT